MKSCNKQAINPEAVTLVIQEVAFSSGCHSGTRGGCDVADEHEGTMSSQISTKH